MPWRRVAARTRDQGHGSVFVFVIFFAPFFFSLFFLNFILAAYLNYSDYNVISVDWSPLAPSPCYVQATYNVALVGNCTAQLLDEMVRLGVARFEDIHVVGFSLGGQVAGNIANFIQSGKLTRITGEEKWGRS